MRKAIVNSPPSPEEFQKQLQEFMRQHLSGSNAVFSQTESAGASAASGPEPEAKDFVFDRKPRDVKEYLDRLGIKQAEAKKVLRMALCGHYHHVCLAIE